MRLMARAKKVRKDFFDFLDNDRNSCREEGHNRDFEPEKKRKSEKLFRSNLIEHLGKVREVPYKNV